MKLSLFTPTHNSTYLRDVYCSLNDQVGVYDWEWVIVPNGDNPVPIPREIEEDKHVRIVPAPADMKGIGALKHFACEQCTGDVFVEMDHDDTLAPTAFAELVNAYHEAPDGFYYSDFVNVKENGQCETYNPKFGWSCYHTVINNKRYLACSSFAPTARALCQIFYAPNHVRAWSRTAYEKTGGHDPKLLVGDDHDLLCRTYIAQVPFLHIPKPLYIYRRWKAQSFLTYNKAIQQQQQHNCHKYLHQLIEAECKMNEFPMVDIGNPDCADSFSYHHLSNMIEYRDGTVGCIRAFDTLQHWNRKQVVHCMNMVYNYLRPGGWLLTQTPSIDDGQGRTGRGAFENPQHNSYWSENNFAYFTQKKHSSLLQGYDGRFQAVRCFTHYPSDWHKKKMIPYVYADLCALKGQRQPGETMI